MYYHHWPSASVLPFILVWNIMVKKFIYWRVRVKLRVNRGIVEMFWWKKKLQNSALLMLIDSEPTPPNTHTHKNNHLIEFLPLPSVSHLIVSPRRDFVQRGTNLKASNTESLDRKFSLFFLYICIQCELSVDCWRTESAESAALTQHLNMNNHSHQCCS